MKAGKIVAWVMIACLLSSVPASIAAAEDRPLKVSSPEALKGTTTVVIGAFNVGFIFESVDSTKATGGMIGAFGGATKAKSELVGVTPEMMQKVADAAYADFKAQLTARGFVVAEAAPMFSSPEFAKVKLIAAPYEVGLQLGKGKGKATYYKPSALPGIVMLPGDVTTGGFGGIGAAMSAGGTLSSVTQHARAAGYSVIDVTYLIDFSNTKRPGAFSFGGLKVTGGMSVVDDYSKMTVISPNGKVATMILNQPVAVEGDFADMADTTKGGGVQKAANILGGLAAVGGFGGLKFGKTKKFTFSAKPGLYEDGATKAATLANTRLVDQLFTLK